MGEANNILRNSIHTFFHGYHSFISIASLLILPFSASLLFSQSLISSSSSSSSSPLHSIISSRIRSLFQAASFPSPSPLFSPLTLMLSQTIFSSLFTLPFTLTFLVLSKSSIILTITTHYNKYPPPLSALRNLYPYLLSTHLFNSFLILSANATIFFLLCFAFGAAEFMGFSSNGFLLLISSVGATVYSIVIANTVVICNLAVMVSAMEKCSGYLSVIRACGMIKGRVAVALSIALPTNLAMAAVEALFQYRVMRQYRLSSKKLSFSIVSESFTIVYILSIIIIVETIASCLFYKSCKLSCGENWEGYNGRELEPEEKGEV